MLANKKIIMGACTLVVILFGSFLFIQNDNIHNISQQITETKIKTPQVVEEKQKEVKEQSKTILHTQKEMKNEEVGDIKTQKTTKYTNNLSQERIANAEYFIRDDGWIPYYLEPVDINNPYLPAFYGQIADEYMLYFNQPFKEGDFTKSKLENLLGYTIRKFEIDPGNDGLSFKVELSEFTAVEVTNIKNILENLVNTGYIDDFYINQGILPEYQTPEYKKIISEMRND